MKLGVYREYQPDPDEEEQDNDPDYERVALYDFEDEEWADTSNGHMVSSTSAQPTPEEIKARFDIDQNAVETGVRTPQWMENRDKDVTITDSAFSAQRGRELREERDYVTHSTIERQAMRDENVVVYPDEYDPSETDTKFHDNRDETIMFESEWDFDFAAEFEFDFETESTQQPEQK